MVSTPGTDELRPGEPFGQFHIVGILGRGGMGAVYRAREEALGRDVALKVIASNLGTDQSFRDRFQREARSAATIEHPNIVPVYAAGEIDGRLFLSTRLIDGQDLKTIIAQAGALPPRRALAIIEPIADALDAAHADGLVHRDVKPANILIGPDQRDGRPSAYLTDFGLTRRQTEQGMTQTGTMLGTVFYMAPEQVEAHDVDGAADQYALAVSLFEVLTGRRPFEGSDARILVSHVHDMPPGPSTVRPDLGEAVDAPFLRAMQKAPADRFPTCADFVRAVREALPVAIVAGASPAAGGTIVAPVGGTVIAPLVGGTTVTPPAPPAGGTTITPPPAPPAGGTTITPPPAPPAGGTTITPPPAPPGGATTITPPDRPVPAGAPTRSRTPLIIGGVAAVAILGGGAAFLLGGGSGAKTAASTTAPPGATSATSVPTTPTDTGGTATTQPTTTDTTTSAEDAAFAALADGATDPKTGWPPQTPADLVSFVGQSKPVVTAYTAPGGQRFTVATSEGGGRTVIGVVRPVSPTHIWAGFKGSTATFGCYSNGGAVRCDGLKVAPETFRTLRRDYVDILVDPGVLAIASAPGAAVTIRRNGPAGVADVCLNGTASGGKRRLCVAESGAITEVLYGAQRIVARSIRGARATDLARPR